MQYEETKIYCPYCGELISVLIDPVDAGHEYTEDCQVCCRPIIFLVSDDACQITPRSEDDAF